MSGESVGDFLKNVKDLLDTGKTVEAKLLFNASKNSPKIQNNSWDLIPVLGKYLSSEERDKNYEVFECSKQLMNCVADVSNPEEALLQFIEEVEEADNDIKLISLLEPLRRILTRIDKRRDTSLAWGLNAIQSYLNKYPKVENENLQGKEKLLLDNYQDTKNINELYVHILHFYESLKTHFLKQVVDDHVTLKFLIGLLGRPLVYLDVEVFDNIKSGARILSEQLVAHIFQICQDPVILLDNEIDNSVDMSDICELGTGSLFYLIFSEEILINKVPKVYDPVYFFQNSLHIVTKLLKSSQHIVTEKGLKLAASLLQHIKYLKLSYLVLDSEDHPDFSKSLSDVIVYNEIEALRKLGIKVFTEYLSSFETHGFYLLIYNLIPVLTHSGLRGYTITMYKNLIAKEFDTSPNNLSMYVKGSKLLMFLRKTCFSHIKVESDLVQLSDEIIATLNLLRYLAIRDAQNFSQIWDFFLIIDRDYLQVLRKGIDMSRAHYKFKIKEVQDECETNGDADINISVKGENLSNLSKEEKIEALNRSLTVFDILESLLSRLLECIQIGKANAM